tara:strand:- start:24929 stop:25150 length:222 start_codon:yes stop_codon:yes gene_type:complete
MASPALAGGGRSSSSRQDALNETGIRVKPENVDIKAITQDGRRICGLGTDNNIYFWYEMYAMWYHHKPKAYQS